MTKELMQLEVDSDLKKAFLACVSRAYNGKVEQGILDLMRIYVERAQGTPGKKRSRSTSTAVKFKPVFLLAKWRKSSSIRQKRTSKLHASISKIFEKRNESQFSDGSRFCLSFDFLQANPNCWLPD